MTDLQKLLLSFAEKPNIDNRSLPNTKETWRRIANGDSFSELLFSSNSEKEEFLKEWCSENDYKNIK